MGIVSMLLLLRIPAAADTGVLEVIVTGVRNANGHVLVAVCDRATFLSPRCAYSGRAPAHPGSVVVRVAGVPAGTYAVEAFQDENDNNVIDRDFLGLPKEGLGFSRDAPMRFAPPAFDDAAVVVSAGGGAIRFMLRYYE